ncbi:MAG: caspase family protein [Alphaproteobacteria bacterium]|nr:caspase family protein [Alphaproteobacteria bacterium]
MAKTYQGYALLIGVNNYKGYSQSVKEAPAENQLSGALNDLRVWWDVARGAGIPARNIRVLSTRQMQPGELETGAIGVTMGLATRDEILEGVEWLAKQAAKGTTTSTLLAFAGHGDFDEKEGLLLCPSDVRGGALSSAVSLKELRALLDQHAPKAGVHAFFDCSFGGPVDADAANGVARARSLSGRAFPEGLDTTLLRSVDKVVVGATLGEVAYELPTRHGWHGPLSHEALRVLDHWSHAHRGDDGEVERRQPGSAAYGELLDLLQRAGLRDCAPCVDKCSGSGDVKNTGPRGDADVGDGSEISGGILGYRTVVINALLANGSKAQVGQINVDTTKAGDHVENWFLDVAGSFNNELEFVITYDGKDAPTGMTGPNVVSWPVYYDDSLWLPAGGKVIPATNPPANVRTYFRNGSPINTVNKWFTLELPEPTKDGKITWWSAYANMVGLLFSDTSKVGDAIVFRPFNVDRTLNANGRFLVELMKDPEA